MKHYAIIFTGLLLFIALSRFSSQIYGEELVKITPSLALTGYYDDNIDFSPQTATEDFYAVISPGISARLNLKWLPIEAGYTYTRYQYRNRSDLNRDLHDITIKTLTAISLFKTKTLTLDVRDEYKFVPINVTEPSDQPSNLTQRNLFAAKLTWKKRFSRKMDISAGYEFSRVDYLSSGFFGDDYFGHRFFARWQGDISRSLILYQSNQYQMKYFAAAPDYTQFLPAVGAHMFFGRHLTIDARYGYSFDQTGDQRENGYVYAITGGWIPTSKISIAATLERRRTTDIQGEPYTERYYELHLRYQPAKRLVLDSYLRYYDYTFTGDDTKRISFKAGATYRLNKWSSFNAGYILNQNVDMPPEDSAKANRVYLGVNITI
jgi:hypothetical protein